MAIHANRSTDPALALRDRCGRIVHRMLRMPGKGKSPIDLDSDSVDDITSETYTRTLAAYRTNEYAVDAVSTLIWQCARTAIADHLRATIKSTCLTDASDTLRAAIEGQASRTEEGEPESLPSGYLKRIDIVCNPTHGQGQAYKRAQELKITALALSKGLCYADTARLLGIAESSLRERRNVLADIFEMRTKKTAQQPAVVSIN
jgi:hypothetical protein